MLWKLFCCLAQSKHAPPSSSVRSPAPEVQKPRDSDAVDVVGTWAASLPIDLFLEILLRLEPAAVVCCAGVCKPWRRAIIDNASILGAHLDRFFRPSLLPGVFYYDRAAACLGRTLGPLQSALPSNGGRVTPANSLIPAAASTTLPILLSSKDGFILLTARRAKRLCLCNPVTGYCAIIPAAAGRHNKYILITGSSPSFSSDPEVRILAVLRRRDHSNIILLDEEKLAYQIFSTFGDRPWVWGPVVQCSGDELAPGLCMRTDHRRMVVCRDAVYWLAGPGFDITCVFALDIRTGRTWTTDLPVQCHIPTPDPEAFSSILATSGDGRLSLLRALRGPNIQVWELSNNAQWSLHQTISVDVYNLLRHCSLEGRCCPTGNILRLTYLSAFCPRSRCVMAMWWDQVLLIDVDSSGLHPRIRRIGKREWFECCPYEIDSSSTCISNMQHF